MLPDGGAGKIEVPPREELDQSLVSPAYATPRSDDLRVKAYQMGARTSEPRRRLARTGFVGR
jgi:hypothetical protein